MINTATILKIAIPVTLVLLITIGVFVFLTGSKDPTPEEVELEIWGLFDDSDVYGPLIDRFQSQYPYIKINYRKKTYENYQQDLLNAMATGRGPDIFFIENNQLPAYREKITPAPANIVSLNQVEKNFVDVVNDDFIQDGEIYALPLYVDTLALYYNKDILNNAGIANPPSTWQDFIDVTEKITKRDDNNNITQAGAAIGTAKNINRSVDILSLLMLQSGAEMVNKDKTQVAFNGTINTKDENFNPGERALRFYTNFSNPLKSFYTWNRQMHYSLDAFYEGEVAMMFNYAYNIPAIRNKSAYLNFDIAPMPQIQGSNKVNYAAYWGLTVSNNSENPGEAWGFINWLANKKENAKMYLENTNHRPTARRDLIDWQRQDSDLAVFAKQSLTAKSWYQIDSNAIEKYFANMIELVVTGETSVKSALGRTVSQINILMRKK